MPVIGRHLPVGEAASDTLYERTLQLGEAVSVVHSHPLVGAGLGATFGWESPSQGFVETEYVDSGWGYLLGKMGLLGVVTFVWMIVTLCRAMSKRSVALSTCLIAATVVMQFSEPCFFHFTTAPCLGAFAGLLLAQQRHDQFLRSKDSPLTRSIRG